MAKRFGSGEYQFEVVEGWPRAEIRGVAATVGGDSQGNIYVGVRNIPAGGGVANILPGVGHIVVLNPDGSYKADWGDTFSSPHNLWVNPQDEIFVADSGGHTITKHAPSGEVLLTLGTRDKVGAEGEPFNMPTCAMEAPNGDIVVSDGYGQNWVHRFSAQGEHILSWGGGEPVFIQKFKGEPVGTPSTEPGKFNLPHHVRVDESSEVLVLDRENRRWQKFTLDGQFLSECTGMARPNDIAVDPDGNFHIVGDGRVEIWTPAGEKLGSWGEAGSEPGQFLGGPHGCWMDPEGSLYIAEVSQNNRLQKYRRI